ncbi:MAG: leucine-rich repeat protein [Clostridium sp.]|nr:leucine-rich repeat protein [Clostridium sp.]MCM1397863.1 leucine-rich repeat protein [Clostridium sp.]MCM1459103.1 leucine-rich repeat protein [Bacteroides sp.]
MMKKNRFIGVVMSIVLCIGLIVFPVQAQSTEESSTKQTRNQTEDSAIEIKEKYAKLSQNTHSEAVYNAKKQGYYFIYTVGTVYANSAQYEIVFYDINKDTYTTVYTSEKGIEEAYINDAKAYFVKSDKVSSKDASGNYVYTFNLMLYAFDFDLGTSSQINMEPIISQSNWANLMSALGVDGKGRIYLATHDDLLYLYDKNGKLLSKTTYEGNIYDFFGFDTLSGNFYYKGEHNWRYWGYDHSMASLMAGNVNSANKISITEGNMMTLYQNGWFYHKSPVTMLNGKYLAALSTFNANALVLLDSNAYDYKDVTEETTTISILTSGVSVSMINIANSKAIKLACYTADSEYVDDVDVSSVGPRCALNSAGTSLIVKTDSNILTEYDIKTKKEKIKIQTSHPIYKLDIDQNLCRVLEREGNKFYIETFDLTYPSTFSATAPSSLKVGGSGTIQCSAGKGILLDYTYKSSNPAVVSVDAEGRINAWKAGTAKITITAGQISKKQTITIKVKDSALSKSNKIYAVNGTVGSYSAIMHKNANNYNYGTTKTAYLTALSNGGFERVEYVRGKVLVEKYDSKYKLISKKTVKRELELFGGFYSGKKYNYLVFGQSNPKESDKKEVIRVVKYDKKWKRCGVCSIKGANTYTPFDAGGLDMAETGGRLYIHTCHTMYAGSDGYNHQANCTFVVNESNMKLVDSYSDVMNLSYGYVSHSFAQQIETDGTYIYRADLGDAYPRGIAITATKVGDKINKPTMYATAISIPGNIGSNYTGYTLSDIKLGDNSYIVAGTGIKETDSTANVYVNAGSKAKINQGITWITNYKTSDNVNVKSPKLVKLNGTQFLLMWEEINTKTQAYKTKMVLLDESGNKVSSIYSSKLALSMCDPVVTKSGRVVWYVTNNGSPVFVEINPYKLSKVQSNTKKLTTFKKDKTSLFDNSSKSGYRIGDIVIKNKGIYKVTASSTVTFCGLTSSSVTSLTVPNTIKLGKKTYKVTAIGNKACYKYTNLKKVVIGANVKKIGAYAFSNCKKLKSVVIKTTKLKASAVGSRAFKGIYAKATIKVPKGMKSAYKKILLKKGVTKKMKIQS